MENNNSPGVQYNCKQEQSDNERGVLPQIFRAMPLLILETVISAILQLYDLFLSYFYINVYNPLGLLRYFWTF